MNQKRAVIAGTIFVFIATVALLLHFMPGPHKPTDLMVIGAIATFLCLLLIWVVNNRMPKDSAKAPREPNQE